MPDYFDESLERIRDTRASEARVYLRVREIIALAADYTPGAEERALPRPGRWIVKRIFWSVVFAVIVQIYDFRQISI